MRGWSYLLAREFNFGSDVWSLGCYLGAVTWKKGVIADCIRPLCYLSSIGESWSMATEMVDSSVSSFLP